MTSIVGIRGDGNAVGNNNRITVIKQQNHHYGGGGKNKGGGGRGTEADWILPAGIGLAIALALASFYFALYSETIYLVLRIVAGVEALGALWAAYLYSQHESYAITTKMVVVTVFATFGFIALTGAHDNYPQEIIHLAQQSGGVRGFWCGLNVYGKQLALLHTLTAGIGFSIGLLFLLPVTAVAVFFGYFEFAVTESAYANLEKLSSWVMVAMGGIFLIAAIYFHTQAGWDTWTTFIKEPPSFLLCTPKK